VFYVD